MVVACVPAGVAQSPNGTRELKLVWEHPFSGGMPLSVVVDSRRHTRLYVALNQGGLAVLESDRPTAAPREVARLGLEAFRGLAVMHLTQQGDKLYVALGEFFNAQGARAGAALVDIAEPSRPRVTALWTSSEPLRGSAGITVTGNHVFLAAMRAGVIVLRESNQRLEHVATFQPDIHYPRPNPGPTQHPNARGITVRGSLAFLAYDAGGLRVLDIRDPRNLQEVGRYVNPQMGGKPQAFNQVALAGDLAYISTDYAGLEVVDVRDPRQPKSVGWWNPWNAQTLGNLWFNSPGHTNQLVLDSQAKRAWLSAGDSELLVVDVASPARPRLVARFGQPGDRLGAWGVATANGRAYLTYVRAAIPFASTWQGIKLVE